jgi:hypothetical protein
VKTKKRLQILTITLILCAFFTLDAFALPPQKAELPRGESKPIAQVIEPRDPVTNNAPGRSPSPESVLRWLSIVAISVFVAIGLTYVSIRKKSKQQDRTVQGVGILNPEKQAVYCHECGQHANPGDNYCRNCGTELRKPTDFENTQFD